MAGGQMYSDTSPQKRSQCFLPLVIELLKGEGDQDPM